MGGNGLCVGMGGNGLCDAPMGLSSSAPAVALVAFRARFPALVAQWVSRPRWLACPLGAVERRDELLYLKLLERGEGMSERSRLVVVERGVSAVDERSDLLGVDYIAVDERPDQIGHCRGQRRKLIPNCG